MIEKLAYLHPEIALFITTCLVMVLGLSRRGWARGLSATVTGLGLIVAGALAIPAVTGALGLSTEAQRHATPALLPYAKLVVAAIALLLLPLMSGVVDRPLEEAIRKGLPFDPGRALRGEFYAFFLFSVTGVMLCATADDLIWLFLALELVSLPTYIMVATSSGRLRAQEAGVKYFFLGAFGAAMFLMGFALLYGAAGTTILPEMAEAFREMGGAGPVGSTGLVLALVGIAFKIAAFPMHFYAADVYQGAAAPVSAYLAFAPKAAGFFAIASLLSVVGWAAGAGDEGGLPTPVYVALWAMAAVTMSLGNVLALLQSSTKRILAYSSVAHSGYMLVGLIAGPGKTVTDNGFGAMLFYLLVYGVMNLGAFAVVACIEKQNAAGQWVEAEDVDDLRGLCRSRPALGWTMVICSLSLLGLPPLFGFFGKLGLFSSAMASSELALVIVMAVNSAAAAWYYLRLAAAPLLESHEGYAARPAATAPAARRVAAVASAVGVIVLIFFAQDLQRSSNQAGWEAYTRVRYGDNFRPAQVIRRSTSTADATDAADLP